MPANQNPKQQLPDGKRVEVVLVEKKKLLTTLNCMKFCALVVLLTLFLFM
jgi:hypothetical protein